MANSNNIHSTIEHLKSKIDLNVNSKFYHAACCTFPGSGKKQYYQKCDYGV